MVILLPSMENGEVKEVDRLQLLLVLELPLEDAKVVSIALELHPSIGHLYC